MLAVPEFGGQGLQLYLRDGGQGIQQYLRLWAGFPAVPEIDKECPSVHGIGWQSLQLYLRLVDMVSSCT